MSSIRLLKKGLKPTRVPNSSDYVRTMVQGIDRLKKINYSILPDRTLKHNSPVLDFIAKSEEEREAEKKEAYLLLEKINTCLIKCGYDDKKINDADVNDNPDNIKIYDSTVNPHLFKEKFTYYNYLLNEMPCTYPYNLKRNGTEINLSGDGTNKFKLEEYIKFRGPVVVVQEFYGCGATCTELSEYGSTDPKYDIYDDRITKIWCKENNPERIVIEEYYRASIDTSINKWNEGKKDFFKSVGTGVYDFIPGIFTYRDKWAPGTKTGEPALYVFDFEGNINNEIIEDDERTILEDHYIENNFDNYEDILNYDILRQNLPDVQNGTKKWILIHRGLGKYTGSEGCLTVFNDGVKLKINPEIVGDYRKFMESFVYNPEADSMNRNPKPRLGLLYLFRDNLI